MRREEEIDLVRKAKEGDTAAFAGMIRRYQNLVYATALQILKDPATARSGRFHENVSATSPESGKI
jgi:Helix-turn-helix domain